jgi:hypothetical protein
MKKLLSLLFVASILFGCSKQPVDLYQGDTLRFEYFPTNLKARLVVAGINESVVEISDGRRINIKNTRPNITRSEDQGDCFVLEAPLLPTEWVWDQNSRQYKVSGSTWNASFGFSHNVGAVYYVQNGLLQKGCRWDSRPAVGWIESFNWANKKSNMSFPVMGKTTVNQYGVVQATIP